MKPEVFYTKRLPHKIKGIQWTGDNRLEVLKFIRKIDSDAITSIDREFFSNIFSNLWICSKDKRFTVEKNDLIISFDSKLYPCNEILLEALAHYYKEEN